MLLAAAGISHPLIRHHFGSRAGRVRALTREAIAELKDKLVVAMTERDYSIGPPFQGAPQFLDDPRYAAEKPIICGLSPLEGDGFELVWGFPCKVVFSVQHHLWVASDNHTDEPEPPLV